MSERIYTPRTSQRMHESDMYDDHPYDFDVPSVFAQPAPAPKPPERSHEPSMGVIEAEREHPDDERPGTGPT